DLFEGDSKVFCLFAVDVYLPIFAAALAHIDYQFCLAGSLETEIKIIPHHATVDFNDSVARLEFQLGAQTIRFNRGNFNPAAAQLGYGGPYVEPVHKTSNPKGQARLTAGNCSLA